MFFDVGGGVGEGAEVKIGQPVFRIHIILIWSRIRIRGSVSVIMDPDPRYLPLSNPKVKNVVINLLCKH